jgi:hypothetical protein
MPHSARLRRRYPLLAALCGAALVGLLLGPARAVEGGPSDEASSAAARRAMDDPDPSARAAAVRRLAPLRDAAALAQVVEALSDAHPYVRRAAAGVLGVAIAPDVRARLLREAPSWRSEVAREEVTRAFALWVDDDGRTGLLRSLADREPAVRAAACRWLGDDGDDAAGQALLRATGDSDGLVRATAYDALSARGRTKGASRAVPAWMKGIADRDPRVRMSALEGSAAAASPGEARETAMVAVQHGLDDAVWSVRLVAAGLAGAIRDRRLLAPLVEALKDPRDRVAQAAGASLTRLTGIPFDADHARWSAWLAGDGASFDPESVEPRRAAPFDAGGKTSAPVRILDMPIASSHVAFVLDASGSMLEKDGPGGTRWDRLRAEMDRVLEALGTSAEGNVVLFSDEAKALFPEAVRFSPAVRARVKEALAARAPAGRTALYDGVFAALADPAVDTVVVISDGAPSAGRFFTKTDVRQEIERANRWRRARIDIVSVGGDEAGKRWRSLLADLAKDSGGTLLAK